MKDGVICCRISFCFFNGRGLNRVCIISGIERPEGRIQRVMANSPSRLRFVTPSPIENPLDRNVSSPTNLQLTVHLKRNCLVNSKALETYPIALTGKNGKASVTYPSHQPPSLPYHFTYLNLRHKQRRPHRSLRRHRLQQHYSHSRQRQQQTHLDTHPERIRKAPDCPHAFLIRVDSDPQRADGEAIVEETEDEEAVETLGEHEQGEEVRWSLNSDTSISACIS